MTNTPNQADAIVAKFGGQNETVRKTGLTIQRVRTARERGYFRKEDEPKIIAAGQRHGIEITAFDFITHLIEHRIPDAAAG